MLGSYRVAVRGKAVAERGDEFLEVLHLLDVRRFVDAVQGGRLVGDEMRRHRLIGEQHELFDEAVRDVAFSGNDRLDLPEFRQAQLGLGKVEINRAAAPAPRVQNLKQRV